VPPDELFGADYPYFSSFTDTLVQHAKANVEARVAERRLSSSNYVVEIASNDGYLLQHYREQGIRVLGIDPAPGPVKAARTKGVRTIQAFFGKEIATCFAKERRADVIHANNVLAHVGDTNGFVEGIATLLADEGVVVAEVPYVRDLIDHVEFDTIYHEHLCYFSLLSATRLFNRHRLYINRVERLSIHGGSLRLFVEKHENYHNSVTDLLAEERNVGLADTKYYANFAEKVEAVRENLVSLLNSLKGEGACIAAYGAAAKGTILLNYCNIGCNLLDYVVDRNIHKQGKWVPGVHLPILAPSRLMERPPDYLLVLVWNFRDEIMQQQSEFKKGGGSFIIPVPNIEVV